jgi:hypothetical protein
MRNRAEVAGDDTERDQGTFDGDAVLLDDERHTVETRRGGTPTGRHDAIVLESQRHARQRQAEERWISSDQVSSAELEDGASLRVAALTAAQRACGAKCRDQLIDATAHCERSPQSADELTRKDDYKLPSSSGPRPDAGTHCPVEDGRACLMSRTEY